MASAQGEGVSLASCDEVRVQVSVPLASVRPPLWRTATREVLETELERRVAARTAHPSHLPLLGEPLRYRGLTPEEAESAARRHLREAEKMVSDAESMNAPGHVVERFRSHAKFMRLQTGESEFRKDKPLPVFILIDGAHRWHVAVSRAEKTIYLSLPRCKEVLDSVVQRLNPQDSLPVDGVPEDAFPASDYGAPESTERGARVNYISHLSSPMTYADRVFLLQSWYLGTLDDCEVDSHREVLRLFLRRAAIGRLLALAVREFKGGELRELDGYTEGLEEKAGEGQKLLDEARDLVFAFNADGSSKAPFRLPPIDVILVAPTASKPKQSLLRGLDVLINCAIWSVNSPASRILMGHALRTEGEAGRSWHPFQRSSGSIVPSAATGTWTMCLNSLDTLYKMSTSMDKDIMTSVENVLGDSTHITAVDMVLMTSSAIGGVEVRDLRLDDDFPKLHGGKYVRLFENHFPEKHVLLKSIIEVALTTWLQGAPFGELCKRLSRMQVVVGNARLGLGDSTGLKMDTRELSFLLRVKRGGVFLSDQARVGYADSGVCAKESHSTKCFLLHVPRTGSAEGSRRAREEAVPGTEPDEGPRQASDAGVGDSSAPCNCDFFTETAAERDMALTHAFFLSRRPLTDLYRSKTPAGTIQGKTVSQRENVEQLWRMKNGDQGKLVVSAGKAVDNALSALEAVKLAHLNEWEDEEEDHMARFVRKKGILTSVQNLLEDLHALAREVGLPHHRDLEERFQTTATALRLLERNWGILDGAFKAYEPEGFESHYRSEVLSLEEDSVVQECPLSNKAVTENSPVVTEPQDIVRRWVMRIPPHKRGTAAEENARRTETVEGFRKRRAAAKAARSAESRGNADADAGNSALASRRKPPLRRPPRKRTQPVTAVKDGTRKGLRPVRNAGPGKSASGTEQDPLASASVTGRPAKKRRTQGGRGPGDSRGDGAGGTAGDGRSSMPVPGVAYTPPTATTDGQGKSQVEGDITDLTGDETAATTRKSPTGAGGEPQGEDGTMDVNEDERRVATDGVPGKEQSHGVPLAQPATPDAPPSSPDSSGEPDCGGGNSTPSLAGKKTGAAVSDAESAPGRSGMNPAADKQVSADTVNQTSGVEDDAGGSEKSRDVDAASAGAHKTADDECVGKGSLGEEEGGTGLAAVSPQGRLDVLATACSAAETQGKTSSLDLPSSSVVAAAAGEDANSSRGEERSGQGEARGRAEQEALTLGEQARDRDSIYLHDVNEHSVPSRIMESAMAEVEQVGRRLPVTLARGCHTKWFVTMADLNNIFEDHAARGLTRVAHRNEGGFQVSRLGDISSCLERAGVVVIADAFDGEDSRRDIDLVVDTPLDKLKLPWHLDEYKSVDTLTTFEPIPNPGGGRSQTSRYYWADKECCRKPADENLARASHRHLVRACHIVQEVLACDVRYDEPPSSSHKFRFDHRCPNTGGRVLVTHPPRKLRNGRGSDVEADAGALPQKPHVDFPITYREPRLMCGTLPTRTRETPLFVIATGRMGTALRAYPGSHLWASCDRSVGHAVKADAEATVVHVPPYSLLMMRGDCFHAGASWLESKWVNDASGTVNDKDPGFRKGNARWHTYFPTSAYRVTNSVHYGDANETEFPDIEKHIMMPVNGNVYEGYAQDFTFQMTRKK